MKGITRSNIYLAITAMILTAALAVPAAAQKQVPFKGSIQAQETDTGFVPPSTALHAGSGTGIGSHVGQFSLTYDLTINIANGTGTGFGHWIAANGDTIDMTNAGTSEPTGTPGVLRITEIYIITGGTGRFEGAQGSFIVERFVNLATGVTSGSFDGTITSPGTADTEGDED
jgi:hypothetical protein